MPNEWHIMIDLETLSNRPSGGAIMSIGAVPFNPYVGPLVDCSKPLPMKNMFEDEFYVIIDIGDSTDRGLKIEDDVRAWWMMPDRIDEYLRMVNYKDAVSIVYAFLLLEEFVNKHGVQDAIVYPWSHGSMYDMAVIFEAYNWVAELGVANPFSHKYVMDTRTVIKTHHDILGYDTPWPDAQMKHHPIDDARRQAVVVQRSLRNLWELTGRSM